MRIPIPSKNASLVLLLLLLTHLPGHYFGTIGLFLMFLFQIARNPRIILSSYLKPSYILWLVILFLHIIPYFYYAVSLWPLFLGIFIYLPIFLIPFILTSDIENNEIKSAFYYFVIIQGTVIFSQYMYYVVKSGTFNIFKNVSIGDHLTGTSVGFSSVIAVTFGTIFMILIAEWLYSKKQDKKKMFLLTFSTLVLFIIPGYMAGVLFMLLTFVLFFVISFVKDVFLRFSVKWITLLAFTSTFLITLAGFLFMNTFMMYMYRITSYILLNDPPLKLKAINEAIYNYLPNEFPASLFGVGMGHGASRVSFILSGEYLSRKIPLMPTLKSEYFSKYMMPLWEYRRDNVWIGNIHNGSILNAPFNQFLSFFSEGGILTIVFIFLILMLIIKAVRYSRNEFFLLPTFFLFSLLFIDNWLAFPNYCLLFWLLLIYVNKFKPDLK